MAGHSEFDDQFNIPGGDGFVDVRDFFVAGARDMEPEEVLLMDGFTLMDAMSAFEIGEPRLDSGMILEEQRRPPFEPLTPLLPEEVCWILDRSFACEMEWHAGKTLSQSVFTLLFVHHLPDINPEYLPPEESEDPARPRWLITVVVRAAVLGLLKCCDFAWRELSKNRVHDVEDWQSEKCDVSLLEGVDAEVVLRILDVACDWLRQSYFPDPQVTALCDRLLLRKTLLQLYRNEPLKDSAQLAYDGAIALGLLHRIRTTTQNPLGPDSPAFLAIDPYIARRLPNFMPIRVTELPPQDKSWGALEAFLEYWQEVGKLITSPSLSKWEAAGSMRFALCQSVPPPFHRSLIQSLFFDKNVVLGRQPLTWLVEHFFQETIGLPYASVLQALKRSAPQPQFASLQDVLERRITKATTTLHWHIFAIAHAFGQSPQLMIPHVKSHWYNPPRRRRHLMKEVLQWHILYDVLLKYVEQHKPLDEPTAKVLKAIPQAAQLWRLSASREVLLSGFQQELYAPEEKPIAYWYLARVLDVHLGCIETVLPAIPPNTSAYHELAYEAEHLAALQMISTALLALTAGYIASPWRRMSLNFLRRYKWVFKEEFDRCVPAEPIPDLCSFPNALREFLLDELYSPSSSFQLAQNILSHLAECSYDWLGHWAPDRKEYLQKLADVCGSLKRISPASVREVPNFDLTLLRWSPDVHPWMPLCS
ncbi:Mak10-domain-containing protein [Trametes punicea]|nr:Mak10-domain-containing protein [Trametes punicea]